MTRQETTIGRRQSRSEIIISDFSVCYYCKSTGLTESDQFCPSCGFPQRGSQVMMKKFIWTINTKRRLIEEQKTAVKKAQRILFGLSIIVAGYGIVTTLMNYNLALLIANLIVAGIYLGLGLWSRKNPFPAILTGFFFYITILVINAVFDPTTIIQGILVKGFIIAGFIYGYKGVKESQALEKELELTNKTKDLTTANEVSDL